MAMVVDFSPHKPWSTPF